MQRKLVRFGTVLGLTALLVTQLFIDQAYASWGAAKLLQLRQTTVNTQPATITNPTPQPPTPEPVEPSQTAVTEMTAEENLMLQLVNEQRVNNGLKPLKPMRQLNELARKKSQDMIDNNYFSHTSPTYGSFANMVYNAGIRFRSVGENLAQARNAKHAFILFMASPGHKANILNPNFTHIGLGVIPYKYGVTVTQLFIME